MSNSNPKKSKAEPGYRWDRWTDGARHRAWVGQHFICSMEAFRRALSTYAGRNGLRVRTEKLGPRSMAFQFFTAEESA